MKKCRNANCDLLDGHQGACRRETAPDSSAASFVPMVGAEAGVGIAIGGVAIDPVDGSIGVSIGGVAMDFGGGFDSGGGGSGGW